MSMPTTLAVVDTEPTPNPATEPTEPTPDASAAYLSTRRSRGDLESDVKLVCDRIISGEEVLAESTTATPHFIGKALKTMDSLEKAPSTGAVNAVLKRWEALGFIYVNAKPYSFRDYTPEARTIGLAGMKAARSEAKKAAKAAAKPAAAPVAPAVVTPEAA